MTALPWNGLQWCIQVGASIAVLLAAGFFFPRYYAKSWLERNDAAAAWLGGLSVLATLILVTMYLQFVGVLRDYWTTLPYARTPAQSASVPARLAAERAVRIANAAARKERAERRAAATAKRHARFVRNRALARQRRAKAWHIRQNCKLYPALYNCDGSRHRIPTYVPPVQVPPYSGGPPDSPNFCDTHDCIPNYPNGNGDTVQCNDGSYSHSGGVQGACSYHGGVAGP